MIILLRVLLRYGNRIKGLEIIVMPYFNFKA